MRRIVVAVVLGVLVGAGVTSGVPAAAGAGGSGGGGADTCKQVRPFEPGSPVHTFEHDGVERSYNLVVPDDYDGKTKVPIIFSFHGLGETKESHDQQTRLPVEATARGYVVVTPQAEPVELPLNEDGSGVTIPFWNVTRVTEGGAYEQPGGLDAADDIGFVRALTKSLGETLCVDTARVFVTGMSNGAGMAIQLACLFPDRYAAAAPVAGGNMTTKCPAKSPVPVVAVHGDADALVDYAGGTVAGFELGNPGVEERMAELAEIDGCKARPTVEAVSDQVTTRTWTGCTKGNGVVLFTIHGGAHVWPQPDSPLDATPAILDFFDAHGGTGS